MKIDLAQRLDPDSYRRFFLFYALITLAGVLILYKEFIFSDGMLYGADMTSAGVFFRTFLVNHMKEYGGVPVWNPYLFCGMPFVDAFHGDIFYPLSFLKYLGYVPRMIGFVLIAHVWLAGITAYLTARQLGLSKLAAAVAGIAYMFTGWLNSLVAPGHDGKMFVTALLPLTILFTHRAFVKRPWFNGTLLGITIGLIILTPHVQLAYFTMWLTAGYTVFKIVEKISDRRSLRPAIWPAISVVYAVILGLALSAIQMLPGYVYTREDSPRKDYQNRYSFAVSFSLHPEEAVSMIVPDFCGTDDTFNRQRRYWGRNSFKDNSEYAGLVPLILGLIGLFHWKRKEKYFFGVVAFFTLLYALGDHTPFFGLCYKFVPLIKSTRAPSMIMFIFSFAVAMLAGMGIQALRDNAANISSARKILPILIKFALPLLLLGAAVAYTVDPEAMHQGYIKLAGSTAFSAEDKLTYARNNYAGLTFGLWWAFFLSTAVAMILHFSGRGANEWRVLILLPLLIMADGIRFNSRFINTLDPEVEFGASPEVEYLKARAGIYRAFGFACSEIGFHFDYHGIMSPIGYHGNQLARYHDLLYYGEGLGRNFINPRFINLVGAKYILAPSGVDFTRAGHEEGNLPTVADFDKFIIAENINCFPRAYLAGQYRVFPGADSLYRSLYYGDDDLRSTVYFIGDPAIEIDSATEAVDNAEVIYYGIDSVQIAAGCASPKILTLSDNYYKDWHVFVDGVEKKPLITYSAFRGVVLEPGEHAVVWKYIPSAYGKGKIISLSATVYVVIALLGNALYMRKRRRQPWFRH